MRHFFLALPILWSLALLQEKLPQARLTDSVNFEFNERFPTFSPETIHALSFGYPRLLSSLLWLRFLQETPVEKVPPGQFSWIYRDLDTILEIDPEFYPAAEDGGAFLSVITEDKIGAERLFLKGIRLFPKHWMIYFYLGYHYLYELKDPAKAMQIFQEGALLPHAAPLMGVLAVTLATKTKGQAAGEELLQSMIRNAKNPKVRDQLERKLEKLRSAAHGK